MIWVPRWKVPSARRALEQNRGVSWVSSLQRPEMGHSPDPRGAAGGSRQAASEAGARVAAQRPHHTLVPAAAGRGAFGRAQVQGTLSN